MAQKGGRLDDVHLVSSFIQNRIERLQSGGSLGESGILGQAERDAILVPRP